VIIIAIDNYKDMIISERRALICRSVATEFLNFLNKKCFEDMHQQGPIFKNVGHTLTEKLLINLNTSKRLYVKV